MAKKVTVKKATKKVVKKVVKKVLDSTELDEKLVAELYKMLWWICSSRRSRLFFWCKWFSRFRFITYIRYMGMESKLSMQAM